MHKDIQVFANDGVGARNLSDANPVGCDADFRYWEGRDDFSVYNHSAARVRFASNRVSVWIDPRATGAWTQCVAEAPLPLPDGWHRDGAWLGLTATTGDLADNHDVLSVQVGPEDEAAPNPFEAGANAPPPFVSTGNPALDASVQSAAAREAAVLADRLAYIHHHMEHQLSSVNDGIKVALKKLTDQARALEEQEASNAARIAELEKSVFAKVASEVDSSIAARLTKLEGAVDASLQAKLDSKLQSDVLPHIESRVESSSRSWLLPFAVLAALILALAAFGYSKYRYMMKTHLL